MNKFKNMEEFMKHIAKKEIETDKIYDININTNKNSNYWISTLKDKNKKEYIIILNSDKMTYRVMGIDEISSVIELMVKENNYELINILKDLDVQN